MSISQALFCIFMVKKGTHEPKAQTAEAYPGFISMKHLGVLLLPPGWDASPSQGYPPSSMSPVLTYTPA